MKLLLAIIISVLLVACASKGDRYGNERIGSLNDKKIKVEEAKIDDALEKAMQAYRKFLTDAPETEATPEAMRRLADLQLEAGSGKVEVISEKGISQQQALNPLTTPQQRLQAQKDERKKVQQKIIPPDKFGKTTVESTIMQQDSDELRPPRESQTSFEQRVTSPSEIISASKQLDMPEGMDNEKTVIMNSNTEEAVALYKELLRKYPLYDRNDQVLYQLARAYEEGGQQEEAMDVLGQLVKQYPRSTYLDEAYFRRGEIFFVRRKYFEAEKSYEEVLKFGQNSAFYDQALFKRGWSFFKQSLYEEGLDDFIRLLDIKTAQGYHLNPEVNKTEYQRIIDTFRVVSYSFSYIGGADMINQYFDTRGHRDYEDMVYSQLGEHYLEKRRYQDAADHYLAFVNYYPFHKRAPEFHIRVMDVYKKGNFPVLVIDAKRGFAERYDLKGEFWTYHDINAFPEILAFIKDNLVDLAKHYHALSQKRQKPEDKQLAYLEAAIWYRAFLGSFSQDERAPELNFLLAEILFDNGNYRDAASEYERTAYGYTMHERASESGYAAILAYKEYERHLQDEAKATVHLEMIRSSLQFAEMFPNHREAIVVLTNAAENLFALSEFQRAGETAERVIQRYPNADKKLIKSAWTVIGHSAFDLHQYGQAENAYVQFLLLTPKQDVTYKPINDRLAAAVYKQGEIHQQANELEAAVEDYLRVGEIAPDSKIRISAEYDAAGVLVNLKNWEKAVDVLRQFRKNYPGHELQFEVTKKLAVVYQESGKQLEAAREYEMISSTTEDPELEKEAILLAADFYEKADSVAKAIAMHERFYTRFSQTVEPAMESMNKVAALYKQTENHGPYLVMLEKIVFADAHAGQQRSDRTQYLAAHAALVLVEPYFEDFKKSRLGEPFQKTLKIKKEKMEKAIKAYSDLVDYGISDVTAASTFKIAEVYYRFSIDLLQSERPKNLSAIELEQYDLILEEQAYPFEEKAIGIYEKNIELMGHGIYNQWIDKSIEQLSGLLPARYGKQEEGERYVQSIY